MPAITNLKNHTAIRSILIITLVLVLSESVFAQRSNKGANTEPSQKQLSQELEYLFIEAEKLFLLQNYSQSTEQFIKCLELDPNNDVVLYKLAEINNNTEQFNIAAEYIASAIRINKANKYYYLLAVDIHTNMGNLQQAGLYYENLIQEIPNTESYLLNLAAVYVFQKDFDKALQTYAKAEKVFGLTANISYQRQKIYLQQNKLEDAINEGKQLILQYPDNPRYVLTLVEILSSNNRLTEATEQLNALLLKSTEFSAARLLLADIYWKQNNHTDFGNQLQLAFGDKDLNLNAKINTLMKYMVYLPNDYLQTIIPKLVDVLSEKHVDDSNAYLISGDIYGTLLEKQLVPEIAIESTKRKATNAYAKFVSLDPSNFSVWQNLLNLELQLDLQDSLAKHAEQALEFFPNQAWIYLVNGIVQQNKKDNKAAAELLEMGRKRSSANKELLAIFYSYLGEIYNELKDFEKSDEAYNAALDLNPLNYTVLNNYSYYLSLRGEKLDQAKKMSTILIRNNPDNNTYLDTYAWVHFAINDYAEAERVFKKILASDIDQGVYYDHYGDTLYKLGKPNEAVIQWQKARELDENIENINKKIEQRKIIE